MENAAERAYNLIRSAILAGEFDEGDRLGEQALAEMIGLSRTPVREALRRLSVEGIVESTPNRGARIARWSAEELYDIFELRSVLEAHAARRAATRASIERIEELSGLAEEMERLALSDGSGVLEQVAELNNKFHRLMAQTAGSARLQDIITSVIDLTLVLRTFRTYDTVSLTRSMRQHAEIVAALRARAPEWAESVMKAHLIAAYEDVRNSQSMDSESTPHEGRPMPDS